MISQKAILALKAVRQIDKLSNPGPVRVAEISHSTGISAKYLTAILPLLASKRVLRSTRGPFGGYALAKPKEDITFLEIVGAIDGPIRLVPCNETIKRRECKGCFSKGRCPIREPLSRAAEIASATLARHHLFDRY